MKRAMYRAVLLALCVVMMAVSLSACGGQGWVAQVGGGRIPGELYVYYLDRAFSDAKKQIGENKDVTKSSIEGKNGRDWVLARTERYLKDFVAVNTKFQEEGLTLAPEEKGAVSSTVSAQWSLSSAHYQSLGIDKTVLTQVQENQKKRDRLFLTYYDTNGREAVPEDELKTWYQENYVGFIAINGYLTTEDVAGNTVRLNSEQEKKLRESFGAMAQSVSGGTAIGDAAATNEATKNQELRESVIYKTGSGYPAGFYDEVRAIEEGKAKVIVKDEYLYVVQRVSVMGADNALYLANRNDVLKKCRGDAFEQNAAQWSKGYEYRLKKPMAQYWYRKVSK